MNHVPLTRSHPIPPPTEAERQYLLTVGRRIRAHRQAQGLTVQALADRVQLTEWSVRRIETGHQNPTLLTLYRLAQALNVPMATLVPPPIS